MRRPLSLKTGAFLSAAAALGVAGAVALVGPPASATALPAGVGEAAALKRALEANAKGRPAYVEFIASHHPVHGGWVRAGSGGH